MIKLWENVTYFRFHTFQRKKHIHIIMIKNVLNYITPTFTFVSYKDIRISKSILDRGFII